ncbi:Poly [ADP-ribose] polymerase 1 [Euphorbia peplus]|nr:Poly [ADP-ribose] polymerase 1 [Euphorbia peplus]
MHPSESVQVVAEYAKSKMSSCKKCSEFIEAKSLRLGLVSRDPRGFDLTKWHHLGCFSDKVGSPEEILGFASLKEDDQEALKKLISGVKDVVEGNSNPASKSTNENDNGLERKKRTHEIEEEHKNPSMPPSKAVDILAEYAKSKRSSCKKCSQFIEAKSLRLGVVSRDRGFDMTKWYHLDCFSDKVESAEEIIGFASLKENDQEALKKLVSGLKDVSEGSPNPASKRTDESSEAELNGKMSKKRKKKVETGEELEKPPSKAVEILAEYAKSKRSSCKTCSQFIEAKTLRLGLVSKDRGFDMTKWYHLNCLSEKIESTDQIIGFSSLKENDQEALKKLHHIDCAQTYTNEKIEGPVGNS